MHHSSDLTTSRRAGRVRPHILSVKTVHVMACWVVLAAGARVMANPIVHDLIVSLVRLSPRTLFVSPTGKDATADGSEAQPFGTIQAAVDAADEGDTVVVYAGIYSENVRMTGRNITLRSTDPDNGDVVANTIIDGCGAGPVITFAGTEDATCALRGFTIRNGFCDYDYTQGGGGICGGPETSHSRATISNNVITGNRAWDTGGLSRCDGLIEKNLITDNYARWWQGGGGLYQCHGIVRNNIIVGNVATGCDSGAALSDCNAVVSHCTIACNYGDGLDVIAWGATTVKNCIFWANHPPAIGLTPQFSSVDVDPCFVDPGRWVHQDDPNTAVPPYDPNALWIGGDYHLKSQAGHYDEQTRQWVIDDTTSPCIDTGDPLAAIGLEPFPNGGIINIGAYGGTVEASKSYFGGPPCETIVAGDINGDCRVDFSDLAIMLIHWLDDNNP